MRSGASVSGSRPALFAGVEPLEVFVELLAGLDTDSPQSHFYDRICEAICRLTTMRRAAIFMADGDGQVRAVGSHGTSFGQLAALRPTLGDTPIAQRALREDQVVVVSDRVERAVPPDYARVLGITTLVCTPLSAAGRGYGVICCDRGGGRFDLSDGERHLLWTLGKTAALVATARIATRQQERARHLSERLELAREVHERVMQRLFGVSLALSASTPLSDQERERCRREMGDALAELRSALERPLAPLPRETGTTLREVLERLDGSPQAPRVSVTFPPDVEVPEELEPLAQSVLREAMRNVTKHARATRVEVAVQRDSDTFTLEVRNDGRSATTLPGGGMGLRLAAFEALAFGGVLEFGPAGSGAWRVRLVAPVPGRSA
jgi:nitrate/nitrite-specific signal transduction histidine kinase